jgi:phosphomannomutase
MRSTSAVCGGELAGHYYFGDFFGCDSGALAALRILSAVASAKKRGLSFSELMRPLVSKYANSGEINYKVEDKASAIERVLRRAASLKDVVSRSDIDGVRLEFADGWINVRCSNTEPYLRLIAEFVDETDLKNMLDALEKEIVVGGSGG